MSRSKVYLLTVSTILLFSILMTAMPSQNQASPPEAADYNYTPLPEGILMDNPDTIQGWLENGDMASIRAHSWDIWRGLTTDTQQVVNGTSLPVWETWYTAYDVFTVGPEALTDLGSAHDFSQFNQVSGLHASSDDASQNDLIGFNKFSSEYASHIWDNSYQQTDTLAQLQAECEGVCEINPFPFNALAMKPVFYTVAQNAITIVPIWAGVFPTGGEAPATTTWTIDSEEGVGPSTWLQCVAIDMTGTHAPGNVIQNINTNGNEQLSCTSATVVDIGEFYNFVLTSNEASNIGNLQVASPQTTILAADNSLTNHGIQAGDSAIFVAMHVTTREIPQWAWMTFWWSLNPDEGSQLPIQYSTTQEVINAGAMYSNYPGGGVDRPDSITSPWKNYVMCTNYQYISPLQPLDNDQPIEGAIPELCFNPYLEAGFSQSNVGPMGGINTNCMACHGNANWNGSSTINGPGYTSAMYIPRNDPIFNGVVQLDFAWSINGNVPPPTPSPTPNP